VAVLSGRLLDRTLPTLGPHLDVPHVAGLELHPHDPSRIVRDTHAVEAKTDRRFRCSLERDAGPLSMLGRVEEDNVKRSGTRGASPAGEIAASHVSVIAK